MKRQSIIIGTLFFWLCYGCEKDGNTDPRSEEAISFSAKIVNLQTGKADDRFEGGNNVGIYAVASDASGVAGVLTEDNNYATNVKHAQSAAGLSADRPILWGTAPKLDIYAYFPWQKNLASVSAFDVEIFDRQNGSKDGLPAYQASDFLWTHQTVEAYTPVVNLVFEHIMSQIVVNVKNGEGGTELLEGAEVKILGHNLSARIDFRNGRVSQGETAVVKEIMAEHLTTREGYEVTARIVTVPQVVRAGTQMIQVVSPAGNIYKYILPEDVEFVTGGSRNIEIIVRPGGKIEVTIGEITAWQEAQAPVNGTASLVRKYKAGDIYNINGVEGFVYKVDDSQEHGLMVSLENGWGVEWSTSENVMTEAVSMDDGMKNMEAIRKIDPDFANYPAFAYCESLNTAEDKGWYLPSALELKELGDIFDATYQYISAWGEYDFRYNQLLDKAWGEGLYNSYYSSTQISGNEVKAYDITPSNYPRVKELTKGCAELLKVRAIRKF